MKHPRRRAGLAGIACAVALSVAAPSARGADRSGLAVLAAAADEPGAGGVVPQRLVWPGIAVIVVVAVFATAALAGPLIRANSQDELGAGTGAGEKPEDVQ